jgi:hypothetical protein
MISAYRARKRAPISRPASSSTSRFRGGGISIPPDDSSPCSSGLTASGDSATRSSRRSSSDGSGAKADLDSSRAKAACSRGAAGSRDGAESRPRRLPCRCCCCCGRGGGASSSGVMTSASARIAGQSKSMSGCCSSIVRIASSSSGERPRPMPGAVRYQYKRRGRSPGRSACMRNVFSNPRRSRVNRKNGTG